MNIIGTVGFREHKEFLDELEVQAKNQDVLASVVRSTLMYLPVPGAQTVRRVNVVGTFLAKTHEGALLISLSESCGELIPGADDLATARTRQKVESVQGEILRICEKYGLAVRPGVYQS